MAQEPRALLLGKRAAVLTGLAAALDERGIRADIAADVTGLDPGELRGYGAVAFGRAVTAEQRAAVRAAFTGAAAEVAYVDGLAPVIPLLVAQLEQALDRTPEDRRPLASLRVTGEAVTFELAERCRVEITAYRLTRLYRTRTAVLLDAELAPGAQRVEPDRGAVRGQAFVVARAAGRTSVVSVDR